MVPLKNKVGLLLGPILALTLLVFFDLKPGEPAVTRTAAVVLLMTVWWVTEAIPIPVTALLPVVLYPMLSIMPGKVVAPLYFNHIIFLFVGGFIMALAMEKWGLHRRIALRIILLIGASQKRIILGFMAASFVLSMWISNTATTMMMMPIAMAIILKLKESYPEMAKTRFATGLLIGIAYAASIGGIATLIGTPPNAAFARIFQISFPRAPEISFTNWFMFGVPFSLVFLIIAWLIVASMSVSRKTSIREMSSETFKQEASRLGKITYEEIVVLILFIIMALLWLFRRDIELGSITIPGWAGMIAAPGYIDDGTIAIAVALLLFIIPAKQEKAGRLMDWATANKLHWGIVLLFGGGFALASGFKESGLSVWIGEQLIGLQHFPTVGIVGSVCTAITFLTELTSNTATTQIILPILGSLAVAIKINPLLLMIPATLSASCAFMLPIATPPNAIVFGSGEVTMKDMIRLGILLNLVGIILVTAYMFLVGVILFHINISQMPVWAIYH